MKKTSIYRDGRLFLLGICCMASVTIAAVVIFAAGTAKSPQLGRGVSTEDSIPTDLSESLGEELSIGSLIDGSPLIVQGTVVATEEPRWNSENGLDWSTEYEADPNFYDTVPLVMTKVLVQITDIVDFEYKSCHVPECEAHVGDTLEVWFEGDPRYDLESDEDAEITVGSSHPTTLLAPGDKRLFFLDLKPFPTPVGTGPLDWQGDSYFGLWSIGAEEDDVAPAALEHIYSLRFAIQANLVDADEASASAGAPPFISLAELGRIIEVERETPANATVASFTLWPWELAYEMSVSDEP